VFLPAWDTYFNQFSSIFTFLRGGVRREDQLKLKLPNFTSDLEYIIMQSFSKSRRKAAGKRICSCFIKQLYYKAYKFFPQDIETVFSP